MPLQSILHIIRHLQAISAEAKQKLLGKKYHDGVKEQEITEEYLEAQLKSVGSKFNIKISDPERIIECAKKILEQQTAKGVLEWLNNPKTTQREAMVKIRIAEAMKKELGLEEDDLLGDATVVEINDHNQQQIKKRFVEKEKAKIIWKSTRLLQMSFRKLMN